MTDLTKLPTFEGKQIRTVEHNGESWIPVVDLSAAWGTDRTTVRHIIVRNRDAFENLIYDGDVTSQDVGLCVNERGLYMLMGKITTARLKNKSARETVLRFQKWVPTLIQQYRKGAITQMGLRLDAPTPPQLNDLGKKGAKGINADAHDYIAALYKQFGYEFLIPCIPPHDVIMRKASAVPAQRMVAKSQTFLPPAEPPLINSLSARNMIAPSPKPEGMLSATDIGRIIGKTAEQVNQWLYNNKYIVKDADHLGEWRLESAGKDYGIESEPYRPHPAAKPVYRVYWYPKILERFNVKV